MKRGEVDRNTMMAKLEERINDKLENPLNRVEMFEAGTGSTSSIRM